MVNLILIYFKIVDAAPNSPKKVFRTSDGNYQLQHGKETFKKFKKEIRLKFTASNGKKTIVCVCFTKVACTLLDIEATEFVSLSEGEQRDKITSILYEQKLLTLKNQVENFLLLNMEDTTTLGKEQ